MPKPPKVEATGFRRCPHNDKFMIDTGDYPPFVPIHDFHNKFHKVIYETGDYERAKREAGL